MKSSSASSQEQVIKYLLSCKRESGNRIYLGVNSYSSIDSMPTKEFIETLFALKEYNLIKDINFIGKVSSKSPCWIVTTDRLIHYFDYRNQLKKDRYKHIIWEICKFAIPTIISIIALIFSA